MGDSGRHEQQKRARRRALQALYQWQLTGQDPDIIIEQFFAEQDFEQVDRALFEILVRGVTQDVASLETWLATSLDRPLNQLDVIERTILRMGAFQLQSCPDVPAEVILDESIELAHRFGSEQGHAYVNGVLDKLLASTGRTGPG